ncbi:hypothetical protein G6F61_014656 [Rhizopus arrhizus]|uniref:Uncharacterized protein n=1 Tax=Rhizopus delemar TaxID=936053 RepID=A0A9P6XNB2_9FUNG|nr:hypothetical protein G6F68_019897 [Rhizopus microsporus]KAG1353058.1 hypothetical protein G6F61_014656 [Rhizopus arrhizus]KAG1527988.1 hypothetical protein G6F50_018271 [Rhizopus delemar]
MGRRTRNEQAKLETVLVGAAYRQPAVAAIAHVGVHLETERADVELECFILVAYVQADRVHGIRHGTSLRCGPR